MGKLTDVVPITLPAPTAGVNRKDPLAAMASQYSPWMLNVDSYPQYCAVRNGYVRHSAITNRTILGLGVYGLNTSTPKLYAYTQGAGNNSVYDVSTSVASLAFTTGGSASDEAYPVNYAARLGFFTEANFATDVAIYNGSAWALSGFTIGGRVGISYKRRVYIFISNALYYTVVDGVTGTMTSRSMMELLEGASSIGWAAVISTPGERASEAFMMFGNLEGEVLAFEGDYPDATNWSQIGRFQISPPVSYNSVVRYRNDTWLLTTTGIVSLKDLFQVGAAATEEESVSYYVNEYWTRLLAASKAAGLGLAGGMPVSGAYWPERNQIYVLIPGHIDADGTFSSSTATMAVFNTITKAWSFHSLSNVNTSYLGALTYFQNNIYFYSENVVMKVDTTGFKDEAYNSAGSYSSYSYAMQSAYTDFGDEYSNKRIVGLKPIIKTDFAAGNVSVKVAADMGREVSGAASVELQSGYSAPYYSVGASGTYLQYRIEGTSYQSATDGLKIFAATAFVKPGGRA